MAVWLILVLVVAVSHPPELRVIIFWSKDTTTVWWKVTKVTPFVAATVVLPFPILNWF